MTEKILQFGTGRFLRAFADCLIDEANHSGHYDGKVVMIASTPSGRAQLFNKQNGRYTLWTRGHGSEGLVDELSTISSVNRVLSASTEWDEVLAIARNPSLQAILSNTTEIGLSLQKNDLYSTPKSFPARLCALLFARAEHFDYIVSKGMVILPCELVDNNGALLCNLVMEQAKRWNLGTRFMDWIQQSTLFCNTLVDRIVPGLPGKTELESAYSRLGYRDELLTVCEPYRLWAVQADQSLQEKLGFFKDVEGIVLTSDIAPYRTRKIGLLNGGHTLSVPVGLLAGCETVLESITHPKVSRFIEDLLRDDIGPVLPVAPETVSPYIDEVLQRWRNPYMHHRLIDITLQSTTKLRHRVVPTLLNYYEIHPDGPPPELITVGFAAWLRFMRGTSKLNGIVHNSLAGSRHPIVDDYAEQFYEWWPQDHNLIPGFVQDVFSSQDLWGTSLCDFPGFTEAVLDALHMILHHGIKSILRGTEVP
ncbi:MAG: tagaturonate reductase [Bacteroidetes bacterium]|nr:tagaturonate reductase [Bacteroidota bacterium]MCY4204095.1 tagaturonate reductase [Bacteroidota bacterium]